VNLRNVCRLAFLRLAWLKPSPAEYPAQRAYFRIDPKSNPTWTGRSPCLLSLAPFLES
jgi:hypothetical protein